MSALRKVLVVDDDPVVGKSFDRVLSDKGYVVITAQSGREALDKLRDEEFDVVFTDIKMPGMDGLEVAERVKARRPWTPVVIITGYGTVANEVRANAAGVSSFLHKPLSPEMIEGSALKAISEAAPVAAPVEEAPMVAAPLAETAKKESKLKNVALFMVAPFIGLAYAMLFPFIGLGAIAWFGGKELVKIAAVKKALIVLKKAAMLVAVPFVGLAFVVLLPFVGIATLAWVGAGGRMPWAASRAASRDETPAPEATTK
jgi:CheY-like chemotaxis protein